MIVIDASAMIDLLARTSTSPHIEAHLDDDVLAPDLLVPEVLRFFTRFDRDDRRRELAASAVADLAAADIHYVPTWPHLDRIWELRANVTSYDACYLAVAEAHGCPLVTTDRRLARAPGIRTTVIAVSVAL